MTILRPLALDHSGGADLPQPLSARLGDSIERRRIHAYHPESLRPSLGPLQVVEEGPHEVAAHIDPCLAGRERGAQVVAQIGDPRLIVDDPVCVGRIFVTSL